MNPAVVAHPEQVVDIAVEPKTKADQDKMAAALAHLAAGDPSFRVNTDEESGQTIISGTSEFHLDGIVDRIRSEFGVGANIGAPQVAYRETITRRVEHEHTHKPHTDGSGSAAHIKFRIEPNGANGFEFVCEGRARLLPKALTDELRRGVDTVVGSGPLIGFPVINLKFVLIEVASDDPPGLASLEIAGRTGLREAIGRAGPKILEPVMAVQVVTPGNYLSGIVGDLTSRRGHIRSTEESGLTTTIQAIVPMSNMFGYVNSLRTLTNGRAQYSMTFNHYEPVPVFPGNDGPFAGAMAMRA